MFCLHNSSKFSCPYFEFSLKIKVMESNPGYWPKACLDLKFCSIKDGSLRDLSIMTLLSGLVGECVGTITTVELRNEAFVTGKIVEVDGFM